MSTIELKSGPKGGRPSRRPDVETLNKLYKMNTADEIARKYNVSPATVRSWISHYRRAAKR